MFKVKHKGSNGPILTAYSVADEKGCLFFLFYTEEKGWTWDPAYEYEPVLDAGVTPASYNKEEISYRVMSGDEVLIQNVKGTMDEIGLLVACEFGDKYFGCNIIQNDPLPEEQIQKKWGRNFSAIAVKEYYEGEGPVSVAARMLKNEIRQKNGFFRTEDDRDGTSTHFDTPVK